MSLPEQITWACTSACTWYAAADPANAFFLVPAHRDHQKQLAFSWQGQQYTFTALLKDIWTLHPVVITLFKEIWIMSLPKNITLMNYINDVMLIGPNEQVVATLETHSHQRIRSKSNEKFWQSSGVCHVKVFLPRWRISHCTWPLLPTRKKCWMF